MSDINIAVDSGTSKRLLTSGKYCDRDIVVTATGGGGGDEPIPQDGKTRIFISLDDVNKTPLLGVCPNGTVTIDWGDGTENSTMSGTSTTTLVQVPHEYAKGGDYVIALSVDGQFSFSPPSSTSANLVMSILRSVDGYDRNYPYFNAIKKLIIGNGISKIEERAFSSCVSVESVEIPGGVKMISYNAFYGGKSLKEVILHDGVERILDSAFSDCYRLGKVVFPASINYIGAKAFANCYGVRIYDFSRHKTIPQLPMSTTFDRIVSDTQILVPAVLYDSWVAASKWSMLASYIVPV